MGEAGLHRLQPKQPITTDAPGKIQLLSIKPGIKEICQNETMPFFSLIKKVIFHKNVIYVNIQWYYYC